LEVIVNVFVVERLVDTQSPECQGWNVVVLNGRWIYSRESDAERVRQPCEPDHDDEFGCWYRVRAISSYEALDLAKKLEEEQRGPRLSLAGVR
jgi:hypothetical protein